MKKAHQKTLNPFNIYAHIYFRFPFNPKFYYKPKLIWIRNAKLKLHKKIKEIVLSIDIGFNDNFEEKIYRLCIYSDSKEADAQGHQN